MASTIQLTDIHVTDDAIRLLQGDDLSVGPDSTIDSDNGGGNYADEAENHIAVLGPVYGDENGNFIKERRYRRYLCQQLGCHRARCRGCRQ